MKVGQNECGRNLPNPPAFYPACFSRKKPPLFARGPDTARGPGLLQGPCGPCSQSDNWKLGNRRSLLGPFRRLVRYVAALEFLHLVFVKIHDQMTLFRFAQAALLEVVQIVP